MKDNYKAWNIDITQLAGSPEDLIRFAVLAPSSHNSQPWKFSVVDNHITVILEPSRTIPVGDPQHRFSTISLGCAVENIVIAAHRFGLATHVTVSEDPRVDITLSESGRKQEADLFETISKRVTNRGTYDPRRSLPADLLRGIEALSRPDAKVTIVSSQTLLRDISKLSVDASVQAMERPSFRIELAAHVRSNITPKKTGIPGFGLGIPTLISLFGPTMIRMTNIAKGSYKRDLKTLENGPTFVILSSSNDSTESRVAAGRIYQRVALMAHGAGLRTSVWGAPIVEAPFFDALASIVGVHGRVQLLFRIGYPLEKDPPHSPRIPAEEVIV